MASDDIEKHLLAGIDERLRGFSRQVDIEAHPPGSGKYRATLQYEKLFLVSETCETREAALRHLVSLLHTRGYRQLRSRLSFVEGVYLGNVEQWIEYADPKDEAVPPQGFMQRLGRLCQRFFHP